LIVQSIGIGDRREVPRTLSRENRTNDRYRESHFGPGTAGIKRIAAGMTLPWDAG